MQITAVDVCTYRRPGRSFVWALVRTDAGITGLGEATLMGRSQSVRSCLGEMGEVIRGMDPLASEDIWWRLYLGDRRRGGAVTASAMGAIDVALWDIRGQALGVPIYRLLGGPLRDRVRLYNHAQLPTPESVPDALGPLIDDGWTAVKFMATPSDPGAGPRRERFDPRPAVRRGAAVVAAAREFVGPEFDLLLETHGRLRPVDVVAFAERVKDFDILFLEEPTRFEAAESFRMLRERCPTPLATGERLYSRWQFQPLIENEWVDIIQPDIVHAHGITEVKKIADYADAHLISLAPHNPQSPVNTMASLQLDLACHNFLIQEVIWPFPEQFHEIFDGIPEPRRGYMYPPDAPGLGITLDLERARALERKRRHRPAPTDELQLPDGTWIDF
ncbi:MAG: mandelate racemase/muconate lactonizing enzyme family protein [Chloroflexi bacterium]|nr:mandelate racemase/muconate lactonizing enzyme family protein [Chloroflexota bacterium]